MLFTMMETTSSMSTILMASEKLKLFTNGSHRKTRGPSLSAEASSLDLESGDLLGWEITFLKRGSWAIQCLALCLTTSLVFN